MGDKIERYSLFCMKIGTAMFIATVICAIGSVFGFVLSESLGFNGRLMDFLVFTFGVFGLVVGYYPAKKAFTLIGTFFE
ncbi:MAG: hypothetical protein IJR05_09555 [Acidaminococcaceae bacterium]|nr:hypothetical protein [Acidaminococcaceae bacterium]